MLWNISTDPKDDEIYHSLAPWLGEWQCKTNIIMADSIQRYFTRQVCQSLGLRFRSYEDRRVGSRKFQCFNWVGKAGRGGGGGGGGGGA